MPQIIKKPVFFEPRTTTCECGVQLLVDESDLRKHHWPGVDGSAASIGAAWECPSCGLLHGVGDIPTAVMLKLPPYTPRLKNEG